MAERRGFLKALGAALVGAMSMVLAVPAAIFYTAPARSRREEEPAIDLSALDRLPEGTPVRATVVARRRLDAWTAFTDVVLGAVWLTRKGDEVTALSTVCPHAGCSIDWDAPKKCFACPCHGSVFAPDGARLEGPSPRAMDSLDAQVKEGRVLVTYRRYRQGVGDKEPV